MALGIRLGPQGLPAAEATADPLTHHGYQTQGPIAAGAFSTIVRAVKVDAASHFNLMGKPETMLEVESELAAALAAHARFGVV